MAETVMWCETHSDRVRPCPFDPAEPCRRTEMVLSLPGELIDPEKVDYEAARDAMVEAHPAFGAAVLLRDRRVGASRRRCRSWFGGP